MNRVSSVVGALVLAACAGSSPETAPPVTVAPNHLRAAPFSDRASDPCPSRATTCGRGPGVEGARGCCFVEATSACASLGCQLCLLEDIRGGGVVTCPTPLVVRGQLQPEDLTLEFDGSFYDDISFVVTSSMIVAIDHSSDAFDAYLRLINPAGEEVASNDDNPQAGLDSRIEHRVEPGVWHAQANSLSPGETGPYTLTIGPREPGASRRAAPPGGY